MSLLTNRGIVAGKNNSASMTLINNMPKLVFIMHKKQKKGDRFLRNKTTGFLIGVIFVVGVVLVLAAKKSPHRLSILNVDTDEVKSMMEKYQDDLVLLDVRELEEYRSGHIRGSVLIPLDQLPHRLEELAHYKKKHILVVCRSGNRSLSAANILTQNGFRHVYNYQGGMLSWDGEVVKDLILE